MAVTKTIKVQPLTELTPLVLKLASGETVTAYADAERKRRGVGMQFSVMETHGSRWIGTQLIDLSTGKISKFQNLTHLESWVSRALDDHTSRHNQRTHGHGIKAQCAANLFYKWSRMRKAYADAELSAIVAKANAPALQVIPTPPPVQATPAPAPKPAPAPAPAAAPDLGALFETYLAGFGFTPERLASLQADGSIHTPAQAAHHWQTVCSAEGFTGRAAARIDGGFGRVYVREFELRNGSPVVLCTETATTSKRDGRWLDADTVHDVRG